jgi:hypothetical protein
MSAKAIKLAARYGRKSDIVDSFESVILPSDVANFVALQE